MKIDLTKNEFILSRFRALIDSNLDEFTKATVLHYSSSLDCDELYLENVEKNIKQFKKFIKYVKEDKRIHKFKHFYDLHCLFCLVKYIIDNDESAKRNLSFLRFAWSVSLSVDEKEFRELVSTLIDNITDEDGNLLED